MINLCFLKKVRTNGKTSGKTGGGKLFATFYIFARMLIIKLCDYENVQSKGVLNFVEAGYFSTTARSLKMETLMIVLTNSLKGILVYSIAECFNESCMILVAILRTNSVGVNKTSRNIVRYL